jgi:hypothetical protein
MERSFDRGQSGNPSDKNQGRAGEFTRKLAEAQPGKDLREPSSSQSSETHKIPKNLIDNHHPENTKEPEEVLVHTHLSPDMQQKLYIMVLPEKFLDIYKDNNKHDRRTAIEFLEKEGDPLVAHKFVKLLTDKRFCKDPDTQLRMISAIGRLKDPSVVPELLNTLSSNGYDSRAYGAIAGVAVMLDRQVAVPKLIEMFRDYKKTDWNQRSMIALAIGMSGDQSAVQKLEELNFYLPLVHKDESHKAVDHAITVLESPSVGKALVEVFSDRKMHTPMLQNLPYVVGKLGDISVAHELVDMLSCYEGDPYYTFDNIPKAVEEIGIRSGNSEEIKELSKKLLDVIYKNKCELRIKVKENIYEAVGELGKILPSEDAEELSKEFGAKLFDERIPQRCAPAIASAMFELELHLAEPDPLRRILNPKEAEEKACKNIKEEILNYRKEFAKEGRKDISIFYEMLSKAAFSNNTRREMRIGVFRPIMKEAGSSFAPKLEELSYGYQFSDKFYKTSKGWYITSEELQRMRKFAQDLRDRPSSSDAERLPQ